MFTLYTADKNKKENAVILSLQDKQSQVAELIKGLNLNIVPGYTGNEDQKTVLEKEQKEDVNRAKKIQELKSKIRKIPQQDKEKVENLQELISQKEKIIKMLEIEITGLTQRKNKAIKNSPHQLQGIEAQQAYLKEAYVKQAESPRLKEKFKDLKILVDEMQEKLQAVVLSNDECDYHTVIAALQKLKADLMISKDQDLKSLNNMDFIKLPKKLATQEALLKKYQDYKEKKKASNQQQISPAQHRTKIIIEANALRAKLNTAVAERVNRKYKENRQSSEMKALLEQKVHDIGLAYINIATQHCIAKLERVDASVQAALQKKCMDAGWILNEKKELVYKDKQNNTLTMSEIEELSFKAYLHLAKQSIAQKPGMNLKNSPVLKARSEEPLSVENSQVVLAQSVKLHSKNILPAFEKTLKNKQKLVPYDPYNKPLSFGLFCLEKALVSISPQLRGIREVKASLLREVNNNNFGIACQQSEKRFKPGIF